MGWFGRKRLSEHASHPENHEFSSLFGSQQAIPGGFAMEIADVFTIKGRGTVVTGTVSSGSVAVGDTVRIQGKGLEMVCRVDGLEAFRKTLKTAQAGMNIGILFSSLGRSSVERGMWVRAA